MNKGVPPLCVIAGPTASGKSGLAVTLAQRANGVIVNADSAQVYSDLQVLSARPGADEMGGIEHRLFGHRDGAVSCSAADWASEARAVIAEVQGRGQLPILVGGTGLYLRTLLDGIAEVPPIDPVTRSEVRTAPVADNHRRLAEHDPEAAAHLHPNDTTRIARALEVVLSTGRNLKDWQARTVGGIRGKVTLLGTVLMPAADMLSAAIDQRFCAMVEGGAIDEVSRLLARRLSPALPVMRAIGVPEIVSFLTGNTDRSAMIAAGQLATRQYAKRQRTWFRGQELGLAREADRDAALRGLLADAKESG
ncbi:tRNA (adenosine(37)-N6)-dimethylallyltransferase MiaA [Sphingomonas glaciei]|uniref:tRNA dimethylallyltransferase n=1 Tax=Sphingomonas glaciei TaxID=2938948 RepID=A0ABY5MWM8_9SPHN|nr:tRNA (adenosine(37)-N6)-dimethylallyltransferase MiaA [Sphingomonas glaciei]UUR08862.1 tRNA (adenosine(37)-N6)-dimethylallyltransferase MiaA [Sphingomonas glaciei]